VGNLFFEKKFCVTDCNKLKQVVGMDSCGEVIGVKLLFEGVEGGGAVPVVVKLLAIGFAGG
jgi:hypothetical protein